jgi:hypothetical protein
LNSPRGFRSSSSSISSRSSNASSLTRTAASLLPGT